MANELLKTLTIDGVTNDALGVGDFLELDANNRVTLQPGYVYQVASSISVANKTALMSNIYTFTEDGWFIGSMRVSYPSNANGIRTLQGYVRHPTYVEDNGVTADLYIPAANGGQTILTVPYIRKVDNGSIAKARMWQNSGSALSVTVTFAGYLIKK